MNWKHIAIGLVDCGFWLDSPLVCACVIAWLMEALRGAMPSVATGVIAEGLWNIKQSGTWRKISK